MYNQTQSPLQEYLQQAGGGAIGQGASFSRGIGLGQQGRQSTGNGFSWGGVSPSSIDSGIGSAIGGLAGPLGSAIGAGVGGAYGGMPAGPATGLGVGTLVGTMLGGPLGGFILGQVGKAIGKSSGGAGGDAAAGFGPTGDAGMTTTASPTTSGPDGVFSGSSSDSYGAAPSAGAGDPGAGADTVICTELHRQGYLDDALYAIDQQYGGSLGQDIICGYQMWAVPIVKLMRGSPLFTRVMAAATRPWFAQMAHIMGARESGSIIGAAMLSVGLPICRFLGRNKIKHISIDLPD